MAAYRKNFRPSIWGAQPEGSIGVSVICADTSAEADRLAKSRDLSRLRLEQGAQGPVPSVAEAEAHPYTREEQLRVAFNRQRQVIGDPKQCKEQLLALGQRYGVEEFVAVTITYDFSARKRSYELLAKEFGLEARN
jgi:alkanesulfonate monooxygenase SsuD/methylene tetrahydromethanopterin reductase-like flavin-dependent oxidoreductase (luciferase family)